jgi:hypothetical protein
MPKKTIQEQPFYDLVPPFSDTDFIESINEFFRYRQEVHRNNPFKKSGLEFFFKHLVAVGKNSKDYCIFLIDRAMERKWMQVYALSDQEYAIYSNQQINALNGKSNTTNQYQSARDRQSAALNSLIERNQQKFEALQQRSNQSG